MIDVKKEKSSIIYQRVIYEEYLSETHAILTRVGRLDMYGVIKEFFLREQRKYF